MRMLDYERQRYGHAAMLLSSRVQKLHRTSIAASTPSSREGMQLTSTVQDEHGCSVICNRLSCFLGALNELGL